MTYYKKPRTLLETRGFSNQSIAPSFKVKDSYF